MTTSSFTKRTGFPASYAFIRKDDKDQLVCIKEHWKNGVLIPKGIVIQAEVSLLCPDLSYIALIGPCPGSSVLKTLYPLYPEGDERATWKLKLKDTYLGGQLRSRGAKERKDKLQNTLLF